MKILTIQSKNLIIDGIVYPNGNCNHPNNIPIYKRLFNEYNNRYKTNYDNFFWGFSKLLVDNLEDAVYRADEMIGQRDIETNKVIILEVPDSLLLQTDFYNFSDEIYAYLYPDELPSSWDNIFSDRDSEKQVIFPYIDKSWIMEEYSLSDFPNLYSDIYYKCEVNS